MWRRRRRPNKATTSLPAQSLTEVRRLLESAGLRPQHRFGQNFLVDLNLLRKVAHAGDLSPSDVVLEVGPGTGSLTGLLLDSGARVVAVEVDRGLQALISEQFATHDRFTLVSADVLAGKRRIAPEVLSALDAWRPADGGAYKLVANLPYQVATPLLMELLMGRPRFERLVCTIQKEVAERLAAPHNCDAYGPVSILAQSLADVERLAELPPSAFWPRPKIDSTLVHLRPKAPEQSGVNDPLEFSRMLQRGFATRRKKLSTIIRNWSDAPTLETLQAAGIDPNLRPEAVSPEGWRRLALLWSAARAT